MIRVLFAVALWCANAGAMACPLCMGAFQPSEAEDLITASHAVLAVPTADTSRFRVIEVVKGERPAGGTVEGGYPRNSHALETAGSRSDKPLLLVRDDLLPTWTVLGMIGADHLGWLRKLAAGKPAAQMSPEDWRIRAALVLPYLESREAAGGGDGVRRARRRAIPRAANVEIAPRRAYGSPVGRGSGAPWLQPLVPPAAGITVMVQDAVRLEQHLEAAAWTSSDATNVSPMIAADLELRGPSRLAWVDEKNMRRRSTRELEAALLALSVQANANGVIPRERVIEFVPDVHQGSTGNSPIFSWRRTWLALEVLGRRAGICRAD